MSLGFEETCHRETGWASNWDIVCRVEQYPAHYPPEGQQWWDGQQWQTTNPTPPRRWRALWWVAGAALVVIAVAVAVVVIVAGDSSSDRSSEEGKPSAQESATPGNPSGAAPSGNTPAGTMACPGNPPNNPQLCFAIRDINADVAEPLRAKSYSCKIVESVGFRCETPFATNRAGATFRPAGRGADPKQGIEGVSLQGSSSGFSGSGASADAAWSQLQKAATDTLPVLFPRSADIQREISQWLQETKQPCVNDRGLPPKPDTENPTLHRTTSGFTLNCGGGPPISASGPRGTTTTWLYSLNIRPPWATS